MSKGSLYQQLANKEKPLQWEFKLKILHEACSALVYLHHDLTQTAYVHGDVSRCVMFDLKRQNLFSYVKNLVYVDIMHVVQLNE